MISQRPTVRGSADGARRCRCRDHDQAANRSTCWWTAQGSSSAVPVSGWSRSTLQGRVGPGESSISGVDADTGQIIAAELTSKDVDDGSQVGPMLEQIAGPIASFTGDGAYDRDDVYREVCQRHPDAA